MVADKIKAKNKKCRAKSPAFFVLLLKENGKRAVRPCSFFFSQRNKKLLFPHGETIALLNDQKRGKSHQRKAPRPPLQTTSHPVELAAGSNARQVCAIDGKSKISSLSLRISSAIPRVRTKYAAKSEQIRRGGWCHAESLDTLPTIG